jgi:hypothetical protein
MASSSAGESRHQADQFVTKEEKLSAGSRRVLFVLKNVLSGGSSIKRRVGRDLGWFEQALYLIDEWESFYSGRAARVSFRPGQVEVRACPGYGNVVETALLLFGEAILDVLDGIEKRVTILEIEAVGIDVAVVP